MEAHVVGGGAIQAGVVPVGDLRETVSGLDEGSWVWVDEVDPDPDDVEEIQRQLNEVMKNLTAWAVIILVPTLVAGIDGMNFRHMPELRWILGYPLALGMMVVSSVLLYVGFRKRGWL